MTDQLKQLSEAATQGEWTWGHFGAVKTIRTERTSMAHFHIRPESRAQEDVEFITALVNAYRAGELVPASEARAQVAVAYEVAAVTACPFSSAPLPAYDEYGDMRGDTPERHAENVMLVDRWKAAQNIRALTPDHATTALEQIRQQSRDEERETANQWRELAMQFDRHRIASMQTIKMILASKDDAVRHVEALRDAAEFVAAPPKAGHDILAEARDEGKREAVETVRRKLTKISGSKTEIDLHFDHNEDVADCCDAILATLSEPKDTPQ